MSTLNYQISVRVNKVMKLQKPIFSLVTMILGTCQVIMSAGIKINSCQ